MFTLTWIADKGLERVIENKEDEFCRKENMEILSGGEKMRNASSQQGENERQWKIKANMNTGNKIFGKHIRQFPHKNNVTRKFDVVVVQNNGKGRQKSVLHVQICFFPN